MAWNDFNPSDFDIPGEKERTDTQRDDINIAWKFIDGSTQLLDSTDGHLAILRAIQYGRTAALEAASAVDGNAVDIRTVTAYESGFEAGKDAVGDAQLVAAAKAWFEMQSCTNTTSLYNACAKRFGSTFNPTEYDDVS